MLEHQRYYGRNAQGGSVFESEKYCGRTVYGPDYEQAYAVFNPVLVTFLLETSPKLWNDYAVFGKAQIDWPASYLEKRLPTVDRYGNDQPWGSIQAFESTLQIIFDGLIRRKKKWPMRILATHSSTLDPEKYWDSSIMSRYWSISYVTLIGHAPTAHRQTQSTATNGHSTLPSPKSQNQF